LRKKPNVRTLAVIPCYNEEATIGTIVLKAKRHVDEVVVVDDGSIDDTAKVAKYAGAKVISHGGRKGYGAAIKTSFQYAKDKKFDVMTILDGDGQHEADQISSVMKPVIDKSIDISIGSRFVENNGHDIPKYRRLGINVLTKVTNAGSKKMHRVSDGQSGFRAYSRKAIEKLNLKDNDMGISAEILMQGRKNNLLYEEVPINCRYDVENGSSKSPVTHGIGVIVSILKYMEVEHSLLFFGLPGLILFISGLIFSSTLYFDYITNGNFAIGNVIVAIILLVFGVLSGMTGLILHAVINANRKN